VVTPRVHNVLGNDVKDYATCLGVSLTEVEDVL
jgi:hypothetical protein